MQRILIADADPGFIRDLAREIGDTWQIFTAETGPDALERLRALRPEVLLLDLFLPGLDGISLLRTAAAEGIRPAVVALTRCSSDYVLTALNSLGVTYIMCKPCDIRALADCLEEILEKPAVPWRRQRAKSITAELLLDMGFHPNHRGYAYLQSGIAALAEKPNQSLNKELYPAIGEDDSCCGSRVERTIRSAILAAWRHRDEAVWRQYFRPDASGQVPRPTNGVFLRRMAECLWAAMLPMGIGGNWER